MKFVVAGCSTLIPMAAVAILLGACQSPASGTAGQSATAQQTTGTDTDTERQHRRCCHRATRSN